MKLRGFCVLVMMLTAGYGMAQDSAYQVKRSKWYTPDLAVMQYAGSIGFISAGAGYTVFKDKARVELLFGYMPAWAGGTTLEALTLKFTALPWKLRVKSRISFYPLTTGIYLTYTPGKEFSSDLPSWYPDGYYWWSEAIRVNLFIGGGAVFPAGKLKHFRNIEVYYEVGTNEIKLVSYVQNAGTLHFFDILHAGAGIRVHFR